MLVVNIVCDNLHEYCWRCLLRLCILLRRWQQVQMGILLLHVIIIVFRNIHKFCATHLKSITLLWPGQRVIPHLSRRGVLDLKVTYANLVLNIYNCNLC